MSYRILDIEVTRPFLDVSLMAREMGIALVVRWRGKPIGFLMRTFPLQTEIPAQQLSDWIVEALGDRLLQERLQEQLPGYQTPELPEKLPSVTIAVCTKDRPESLVRCVRSLLQLQRPQTAKVEILVVDNAPSSHQTQHRVMALPGVRYVREPKAGLDFARNCAIRSATGELLAFVDDDVVVDAGWLMALWQSYIAHPDAGAWTGQVLPYELETDAQILFEQRGGFRRGFEPLRFGRVLPENPLYPCAIGLCGNGCNMVFRRELLIQLNGFDEALDTGKPLPGGGDHDIFYRIVRTGTPLIYEPACLVFHQHRREPAQLRRQYWSWGLAVMAFLSKCYQNDPAVRSQIRSLIRWWFRDELRQILRCLRGSHPLPTDMVLAELWGGVVGLLGEYGRSQRRSERVREESERARGEGAR